MAIYLASYKPLRFNSQGNSAAEEYDQPRFVDHATRREPALECKNPGISAICRADNFAPRLSEEDVIAYITIKGKHLGINEEHWCLVAILKVIKKCVKLDEAAIWYREKGIEVPNNCMVEGTVPLDWRMTAFNRDEAEKKEQMFKERAINNPVYLICEPEYLEINIPPPITNDEMIKIFGRIPPTETPTKIKEVELNKLRALIKK